MASDVGAGQDIEGSAPRRDLEDMLDAVQPGGRRRRRRPSAVEWVLWAAAAIPGGALALLLSMAVRVRLADGRWPSQDQPDPKDLGLHNTLTVFLIVASFAAVVLVPLGSLAAFAAGRRRLSLGPLAAAVGLFAILFVVLWADVAGLGDWIAD